MRRISIAIALTILLLASLATAQQTTGNPSANSDRSGSPTAPPGPIIGGMGTTNYIPIWASSSFLVDSVIYQTGGNVGVGTTTPAAKLDVNGYINSLFGYDIGGVTALNMNNHSLSVGFLAGAPDSGQSNTFIGNGAGYVNAANENTFTGAGAGTNNTTGSVNAFYGNSAGGQNTDGSDDVFVGSYAGVGNTHGNGNTFVGWGAGWHNTTGSSNIFIGDTAGYNNTTGQFDVYIWTAGPASGTESNTLRLGDPNAQNTAYIAGVYGSTSASGIPVYIDSNGQLGTQTSSLRFKEQIADMGDSTAALMKLRPVTFVYKPEYSNGERTLQYGLIAEEVAKVYPELVAYDNEGQPYSVRYQYLSTMLLNEAQKQYRRAEAQAEVIKTQEQKIDSQQSQIEEMQQRLSRLEAFVGTRTNTAQIDPEHHKTNSGETQ
jgi:hypothetical protein